MKQKLEDYIYEQVKANLSEELQTMCVKGHTKDVRPVPYICVEISELKPFGEMQWLDYIYDVTLNISIADSAHDIDYEVHSQRRRAVEIAVEAIVLESENFLINYINLDKATDARDDNNIGDVLEYSVIVQALASDDEMENKEN